MDRIYIKLGEIIIDGKYETNDGVSRIKLC
jgi:hypothetical protein